MWTTYNRLLRLQEEQHKKDIEMWERECKRRKKLNKSKEVENAELEKALPNCWEILEGEDEPLPWSDDWKEDKHAQKELKKKGIYTVPLGEKLNSLIYGAYKEDK